ncbi:cobalamin B12-binding domain-containing protein [Dethiosulfatarculus sandiegensis]|uniref:Methionine synthase n=1 Tax=Dethiosulfatarculus sandiegensis TaxID=1429043 RepID=A0A0D2GED2_9BACT|nr:cobalamin-dependent protein [Dethiosulfatarculus sandiegensis]KIX13347.1 methionine synthase [Dethiosulfatarculus sandiegensis]
MADLQELYTAIVEMQEETAMELTNTLLDEGVPAMDIFNRYQDALGEVGQRFEKQLYFIPELIMSGEMMKAAADILKPYLAKERTTGNGGEKLGKVVMATVQGDIHDIGKNIATMMLELNGLDVKDLGVDVPTEKIIEEAKAFGADVIGLSGLLTLAFDPMKSVVDKLKDEGLRDDIKVLIGGGQMDEQVLSYVGADAYVTDAVEGVSRVKGWVS